MDLLTSTSSSGGTSSSTSTSTSGSGITSSTVVTNHVNGIFKHLLPQESSTSINRLITCFVNNNNEKLTKSAIAQSLYDLGLYRDITGTQHVSLMISSWNKKFADLQPTSTPCNDSTCIQQNKIHRVCSKRHAYSTREQAYWLRDNVFNVAHVTNEPNQPVPTVRHRRACKRKMALEMGDGVLSKRHKTVADGFDLDDYFRGTPSHDVAQSSTPSTWSTESTCSFNYDDSTPNTFNYDNYANTFINNGHDDSTPNTFNYDNYFTNNGHGDSTPNTFNYDNYYSVASNTFNNDCTTDAVSLNTFNIPQTPYTGIINDDFLSLLYASNNYDYSLLSPNYSLLSPNSFYDSVSLHLSPTFLNNIQKSESHDCLDFLDNL